MTLMLSHLGDQGATFAIPVVVPPAAATLFLGSPERSGAKAVRRAVLAFDHTIFNGREAALYLEALRGALAAARSTDEPEVVADATAVETAPAGATALERLTELACEVIGHPLDADRPLGEQGFDSARALHLIREARKLFDVHLPATAMWRYPTLRDLAGLLPETTAPAAVQAPSAITATTALQPAAVTEDPALPDDGVAVIGMACRVPGADGPEAYWSLLAESGCRIGEVPPGRLAGEVPEGFRAGLLDRVDLFDAAFFGITPRQAASMDPPAAGPARTELARAGARRAQPGRPGRHPRRRLRRRVQLRLPRAAGGAGRSRRVRDRRYLPRLPRQPHLPHLRLHRPQHHHRHRVLGCPDRALARGVRDPLRRLRHRPRRSGQPAQQRLQRAGLPAGGHALAARRQPRVRRGRRRLRTR
ncbi:hypothetical protein GCM10020000_75490 [Streptomyces olivoverticillatus]